ncbi:DDE 3 domain containing protein [Asbolus verrucosus]|uniref:DDE 3 domain containing protein n=1 Tax=Asbolus verrucosus TaxID=1661398 RepID=A0A482VY70_ASBVE|nr:DDE 3 domain containing protein [Asbolus verrucosus]
MLLSSLIPRRPNTQSQKHRTSPQNHRRKDRHLRLMALRDRFTSTRAIADQWFTEYGRTIEMRTVYRHIRSFGLVSYRPHFVVRKRHGERRDPQFSVERHVHRTVGVMVWGGIAYRSRSHLIFIRGNMTAQRYIREVVESHVLPYLRTLRNPLFQQDNARPHVAKVTLEHFQQNEVNLLP